MKTAKSTLNILMLACLLSLGLQNNSFADGHKKAGSPKEEYVCLPCGYDCDNKVYHEPGKCPGCNMQLVKKSTVNIKNIQPSEMCNYLAAHPNIVLLDVRTKEEFEGKVNPDFGTLKNAINIPINELPSQLASLSSLKKKKIIVYCSHSHRSPQAAYMLMQNGFSKVMNMAGGMSVLTDSSCKVTVSAARRQELLSSLTGGAERLLRSIENSIIQLADAMPEDKFNFTPESLAIKGSAFESVRTFAGQIKHLATDNYDIWRSITGDPLPPGVKDVDGPENIKSKADIMKYLRESFVEGHKAIATLTAENAMDMLGFRGSKLPRLDLVFYALTHANEHYGQMVVYLRMCGIVPPGSMVMSNSK